MSKWIAKLQSAQKTCMIQDGKRKIHYTFIDGNELAEEYDLRNNEILVRKWKRKGRLGGEGKWEFEIGTDLRQPSLDLEGLTESNTNPVFARKDTATHFQWRIRNLPYPKETYNVTVDGDNQNIIIKTTNKKYYKKYNIPDMERAQLPLNQESIQIAHANNTLIISYKKPREIIEMEKNLQEELKKLKANKDGDVDCTPS